MEGDKILQDSKEVRLFILEEFNNHKLKMSSTRLNMATNATSVLCQWIERGLFYNDGSLRFSLSSLSNCDRMDLFFSLGILLGIYKGIPKSRKITRVLEKIKKDLFSSIV